MKILFQGDSITDALRVRENDAYAGAGYATLVSAELGFENPAKYEFVNRGISGNRVVDLLARIKVDMINLKPDVMSILIGVNDVWHELGNANGVSTELFEKVYGILIEELKKALPEIKIMILEPFVLKASATEEKWNEFKTDVAEKAAASKRVAEKYGLKFIELQKLFDEAEKTAPASFWLVDGVHPSAAGHELIKREWIKAFKTL